MNQAVKNAKITLTLTIVGMAVSSLSLSLIPFTSGIQDGQNNIGAYCIAAAFWLGLILALVAAHLTKRNLRRWRERLAVREGFQRQRVPGIVYFSWNKRNAVIYIVAALGLALMIADMIFTFVPEMMMFPIISVTLLSFMLHCVLDGQYYKVYQKIKESMDDETRH